MKDHETQPLTEIQKKSRINVAMELKRQIWLSNANLEQFAINLATAKPFLSALRHIWDSNNTDVVMHALDEVAKSLPDIGKQLDDIREQIDGLIEDFEDSEDLPY